MEALILDLLEWVDRAPRSYAETMAAWRTACPRLTVWEDAVDRGLVLRTAGAAGLAVALAPAGRHLLAQAGRGGAGRSAGGPASGPSPAALPISARNAAGSADVRPADGEAQPLP